jgi:hypothetical protein
MGIWGLLGKGEIVSRAAVDFYPPEEIGQFCLAIHKLSKMLCAAGNLIANVQVCSKTQKRQQPILDNPYPILYIYLCRWFTRLIGLTAGLQLCVTRAQSDEYRHVSTGLKTDTLAITNR